MTLLYTEKLALGYGDRFIVDGLNVQIPEGKITALVGANGSGKSTILKAMARIMAPKGGAVYLEGKAIHRQSSKKVAQQMAILPQGPEAPDGLTVGELVSYGRFPYQSGFGARSEEDNRMIRWALDATGMTAFAGRPVGALSGGQRQRAWIAMALAQGTRLLLLDEPTTYLDMAHQVDVLQLLKRLNADEGRTVVMVVHDLNHAARYAHYMVAIADGTVVTEGAPAKVMTPEILRRVFGVEADVIADPRTGVPLCLPYGLVTHAP